MKICKALQQLNNEYPMLNWNKILNEIDVIQVSASIVIPIYNSENTIIHVLDSIEKQMNKELLSEVVLVDDMSTDETVSEIEKNIAKYSYNIKLIKSEKKLYGGGARNLGVKNAIGDIILFLDSDIMIPPNYLMYHVFLHNKYNNLITLSFRSTIPLDLYFSNSSVFPIEKYVKEFRLNSTIKEKYLIAGKPTSLVAKEINLYEDTKGFRKLGLGYEYFWNLPEVCSTCCISYRKDDFIRVGGMIESMVGWGYDDVALAAKVLTLGRWVIPILEAGVYHIEHPFRTKSIDDELEYNLKIYNDLLQSEICW